MIEQTCGRVSQALVAGPQLLGCGARAASPCRWGSGSYSCGGSAHQVGCMRRQSAGWVVLGKQAVGAGVLQSFLRALHRLLHCIAQDCMPHRMI